MGVVYFSYAFCFGVLLVFTVFVVIAHNKSKHVLKEVLKNEKKT